MYLWGLIYLEKNLFRGLMAKIIQAKNNIQGLTD